MAGAAGRICCTQEGKLMSTAVTAIGVRRVAGNIGAEITGVRAAPDLPGPVVKQIRDALLEHKVIFFRGQDHLDDAAQAGFAQLFGELSAPRRMKPGDGLENYVNDVDGDRSRAIVWHTDRTTRVQPTAMTILRPIVLPPYGGDTAWANTAAAYQRLGPDWQRLAEGLRARHTNNQAGAKLLRAQAFARNNNKKAEARRLRADAIARSEGETVRKDAGLSEKNLYEAEHPVVHVHPETGERALLLGAFAKTIIGRDDSESLLNMFHTFVTSLDNTVRWRWAPGDVAMWDNRATQHCGIADFGSHKRLLHRCTIVGHIPVGVDGRPSTTIACPA
jgi:taurine dioxygenase